MAAADDYDTAMSAVATALGSADYATARSQLLIARAHALRMPQSVGADGASVQQRALSELAEMTKAIAGEEARVNKFEEFSTWVPE